MLEEWTTELDGIEEETVSGFESWIRGAIPSANLS